MTAGLNDLAERMSNALTCAHPEFAESMGGLDQGDVELHVTAPAGSEAGALRVSTARGEDTWIRFASPEMFYSVDSEEELLQVIGLLLQEQVLFVRTVDASGNWAVLLLCARVGTSISNLASEQPYSHGQADSIGNM